MHKVNYTFFLQLTVSVPDALKKINPQGQNFSRISHILYKETRFADSRILKFRILLRRGQKENYKKTPGNLCPGVLTDKSIKPAAFILCRLQESFDGCRRDLCPVFGILYHSVKREPGYRVMH